MTEIHLTGITAANPLGALAAFGFLRVCNELEGFSGAKMLWRESDETPVVVTTKDVEPKSLPSLLAQRQALRIQAREFTFTTNIKKLTLCEYAEVSREAESDVSAENRGFSDFLAAYSTELVNANVDGTCSMTLLYMVSAQQTFPKSLAALAQTLDPSKKHRGRSTPEEAFREALFGPWRYEDNEHSLGLDGSVEKTHVFEADAPTLSPHRGVRGAVWLAVEALPFFPCIPSGSKSTTFGFARHNKIRSFSYPIWSVPIGNETLTTVLGLEELTKDEGSIASDRLRSLGITAIYRTERVLLDNQGRASFRMARRVA